MKFQKRVPSLDEQIDNLCTEIDNAEQKIVYIQEAIRIMLDHLPPRVNSALNLDSFSLVGEMIEIPYSTLLRLVHRAR